MEPATEREINLFDVADWLWSYRILATLLALAGLAGAVAVWLMGPPAAPTFRTNFAVYSSGTPVRTVSEIIDILNGKLSENLPNFVSGKASNPLVVNFASTADVDAARRAAEALEASLLVEVKQLQADTTPLVGNSESALTLYLDAKAFIEGSENGLIKIIRVTVEESRAPRSVRTAVMIVVGAALLFLALAASHSFWTRWRALRRAP